MLKIYTGRPLTKDEARIDSHPIRFVAEDGRTMFEVSPCRDGKSVEIRGVECVVVGGELYSTTLVISPVVSNCIQVSAVKYEDE